MSQPTGFQDVDQSAHVDLLVQGMRDTATWPAVVELRAWSAPALEVPDGGAVLDVGCGLADVLIDLAVRRPDARCVGVDVSDAMLSQARADAEAVGASVELQAGSALALPFEDATFDAVRSERVLQWLDDPEAAIREMGRVTRPGGTLVALDTDWRTCAMDLPDPDLERRVLAALARRPGADSGGRLRNRFLDLGLEDVREHAATAIITWDPDVSAGPPGLLPPWALADMLVNQDGMDPADAQRVAQDMELLARRGRFHVTVSILAVTGCRPA